MSEEFPYPLVSTDWLAAHLGDSDVKVIDGSWRMPGEPPAINAHVERRIQGAVFFDLDEIADKSSGLPHMLPPVAMFETSIGRLGINEKDRVIVYDDAGLFSAARVWWTFRALGHDHVSVLDGGLPKWLAEGRAVIAGPAAPQPTVYKGQSPRAIVADAVGVRRALDGAGIVLDARGAERFTGEAEEPRAGLRSGHMPGAKSLPYSALLDANGRLRPTDELAKLFHDRDVHMETEIVASCGSGVTAAVIALALERLGHRRHAVYDGSWAEWGDARRDPAHYPVVKG